MISIWIAAFIAAFILVTGTATFDNHVTLIALGAALGGAAEICVTSSRKQSVRDFIDTGWWPEFNVADIAIVCGLVIAIFPR